MTHIVPSALSGEVLTRDDLVRLIAALHPLKTTRVDMAVPAGFSLAEMLTLAKKAGDGSRLASDFSIAVDGVSVPSEWWPRVRPKRGATVVIRAKVHGDGGLRTILMFAAVIAAAVVAPYLVGALLPGLTGIALAATTAAVTLGLTVGATMAIGALFPISPTAQLDQATREGSNFKSLNGIQGAQNQARPYDPIPAVLGVHRQSPFYGAKPYTEIAGDDQYLRLLFVWGYGPLDISDLKIGETPLSSFTDYEIEHRYGYDTDTPLTLFPGQVHEEQLSVELTSAGGWSTRTTGIDADEISIDITAPQGIYSVNTTTGNLDWYSVAVAAQYRAVGSSGSWTDMPGVTFGRYDKTGRLNSRVAVARGQYDVRVQKTTADANNTNIRDQVIWTALRSFTNDPPISFPKPLAMTALRIKATDQLNGVLDTLNGITSSKVKSYNGSSWVADTISQNPADLIRHVLQSAANPRAITDSQLDLPSLQGFRNYCNTQGFKFNQVVTNALSIYEQVSVIAAAGRAFPSFINGKWGVVWDRPDDTLVQQFTPRNSWGFSGSRKYQILPHGFRTRFINEDNGYTQDERVTYDDGYDANNATLFESVEFPGVTDPDLIYRHARFQIAQARLRPETFTINSDWENIVCQRGDRVSVQHDVALIGQASGRVKAIDGQVVTLDEAVTMVDGTSYGIQFRLADGTQATRAVTTVAGEQTQVTVVGTLPSSDDADLAVGDLFSFGEADTETANYRVLSISFQPDFIAQITLVDDAPAISTADSGTIPAYNPHVTIPTDPYTLPPQSLKYIEFVDGFGPNATVSVRLSWTAPKAGKVTGFEIQNRDETNDAAARWVTVATVSYPTTVYDVPLIASGLWSYRVRSLFSDGTSSAWSTLSTLNLLGLLTPPDAVENFRSSYNKQTGRVYLTWDALDDNRGILYEIRKGASWDAALVVGERITQPKFETVGDDTYWIAPYVITPFAQKIYSDTKHSLALTGSVLTQNVVVSRDERAHHWDGYFGGTVGRDDDLNYLRTSGTDNFLAETDVLGLADFFNKGGQGGGYFRSKTIVDAGRSMPCRVSVDYSATAVPVASDFLADPDFLNNPDFLQSYLTQYIRVYPVIRVGTADDPDVFAPSDIFAENDAFAAGITWGAWQKWSPDVYVGRFYQLGLIFEILDVGVGAIAYGTSFSWIVDVEDRLDRYQNLTVPVGGLDIEFTPTGYDDPVAFKGGINNDTLPHILTDLVDRPSGYQIKVTNLTLSGCHVTVLNASGVDVGSAGVNILAQGY